MNKNIDTLIDSLKYELNGLLDFTNVVKARKLLVEIEELMEAEKNRSNESTLKEYSDLYAEQIAKGDKVYNRFKDESPKDEIPLGVLDELCEQQKKEMSKIMEKAVLIAKEESEKYDRNKTKELDQADKDDILKSVFYKEDEKED